MDEAAQVPGERQPETSDTGVRSLRSPFVRRALVVAGIGTALVLGLALVWAVAEVLLLIFAGILVAILLRGLSRLVSDHTPLSEGWSLALVVLALVALWAAGVVLLGAQLVAQAEQLAELAPRMMQDFQARLEQSPLGRQLLERAGQSGQQGASPASAAAPVASLLSTMFGGIADVVIVLFVGLYLAVKPDLYVNGLLHLLPIAKRPRASAVLQTVGYSLRRLLVGQLISMIVVGVLTTVGLLLLGVPLGLLFGVLAGILEFVPTIGPLISAVPAVLLALTQGPSTALYVVLLYAVIQIVEGNVLTPLVLQRAVELPPVLTIAALVMLGTLFGFLGLLLATPLLATALVVVKMLYVQDVLGDPIEVAGEPEPD
ncbi:MAG TPA: AI-2E family transporter [Herpetosiphonaceae bacterium]|nr:AI-2E family transporter [Herpetosiphonaceae bacterium]